jgi:hypothetical protein
MLPTVIPHCTVRTFKYWQEGIKIAMCHQNEFFTQIKFYGINERLQAYEEACKLSDDGIQVCITVSERGYLLWKNLKHFPG